MELSASPSRSGVYIFSSDENDCAPNPKRILILSGILLSLAIFASVSSLINAQVPYPGKCPEGINAVSEFDLEKYLGTWYEHSKYPAIFELGGKCISADYGKFDNGSVSVVNNQINKLTGKASEIKGYADVTDEPGKIIVNFPSTGRIATKSNYWVLSTDYTSYSVVYSCMDLANLMHGKIVWILTRERSPAEDVIAKAHSVLDENKLSKTFITKTDQSNC